ncbi:MAG TPA: DUF1015 domain-containing protein [Bacteroidetes bacterium]|nr:DUF1015 domain-containing protein [Bacteroidota bacterium]
MITIRPFAALRPKSGLESKIASRPYDVLSSQEARHEAQGNEKSFYRIIKPEINLEPAKASIKEAAYAAAKNALEEFIREGWLQYDQEESYYIYRQKMKDNDQYGLVCLSSVEDYMNDRIKKHEFTRPAKEEDRIHHMYTIGAHPGPVFLAHHHMAELAAIKKSWCATHKSDFSFTSEDDVLHEGWTIDDDQTIEAITGLFFKYVSQTYIADGHHRSAASARVGLRMRQETGDNKESYDSFLSVLFDEEELDIWDYNRVIKDLNGYNPKEFLSAIAEHFDVTPSEEEYKPIEKYTYGMLLGDEWFKLELKDKGQVGQGIQSLDIQVLSDLVLDPLLGIKDQRTDPRINFVGGIRGMNGLEEKIQSGQWALAFSIHPVSMRELFDVADSGQVMPPKSTWFEPKLRSGLFINHFNRTS